MGMDATHGPFTDVNKAKSNFEKKFQDKTKNKWANKDNFTPQTGKIIFWKRNVGQEQISDIVLILANNWFQLFTAAYYKLSHLQITVELSLYLKKISKCYKIWILTSLEHYFLCFQASIH